MLGLWNSPIECTLYCTVPGSGEGDAVFWKIPFSNGSGEMGLGVVSNINKASTELPLCSAKHWFKNLNRNEISTTWGLFQFDVSATIRRKKIS
jgi:hypothetical protein